ncbi:MMPL family transporter [Demequina muriae]|uniref:MMPL family transporter n=1 Tax=Demequina muriae TaxID=3051664 RepID=A0ABT8GHS1_9MICO|nr:MMPL family transporter [Demequina sp. EGI L300058]MDN4480924.1 MMPL family transporter [Demequina sp. EGI L300058]
MSTGITGRIARTTAARPWLTIIVWVVALASAGYAAGGLGDALTQEERMLITTESGTVQELDEALRGSTAADASGTETIIVAASEGAGSASFGDAAFGAALDQVTGAVRDLDGVGEVVVPTAEAPYPVSEDGSIALVSVALDPGADGEHAEAFAHAVETVQADGFEVRAIGPATGQIAFDTLAEESLIRGEAIGIGVALIILVIVFGALVAAGIPLLVALVSIVMAVGATALVGQVFELSFFVVNMVTMMGLALGIDYSLVMVQRFREELAAGRSVIDAVTVAGSTANRAVLFSGITVVIALVGLLIVPSTIMRSLGAGAIIVATMSVLASLTLLPAVLRLLGHRVNKGRVPTSHPGRESRAWRSMANGVIRRPVVWGVAGIAVLGLLAAPAMSMRLTFPGIDSMPEDNDLRIASETLVNDFGLGQAETTIVVENAGGLESTVDSLAQAIEADEAFAETTVEWTGDTAFIDTRDVHDAADPLAEQAIERLRDVTVPAALVGTGAIAHVGGEQASSVDFSDMIADMAPWVLLIVLGSSFVLLLFAFRSVVVPALAIALNLLSTAAAFGMLVAVFQWGWGASLLGFPQVDGIAPWIPLFLFAVLFGLSMDYHVFLLSRIKERFDATGDTRDAVAFGLSRTGSLITGAALIMVAVFGGFALGDLAEFAQMGFGLAAAVILDATVVRSILVPALMTMLGRANWYLPRWLGWLPVMRIEGGEPVEVPRSDDEREPVLVRA